MNSLKRLRSALLSEIEVLLNVFFFYELLNLQLDLGVELVARREQSYLSLVLLLSPLGLFVSGFYLFGQQLQVVRSDRLVNTRVGVLQLFEFCGIVSEVLQKLLGLLAEKQGSWVDYRGWSNSAGLMKYEFIQTSNSSLIEPLCVETFSVFEEDSLIMDGNTKLNLTKRLNIFNLLVWINLELLVMLVKANYYFHIMYNRSLIKQRLDRISKSPLRSTRAQTPKKNHFQKELPQLQELVPSIINKHSQGIQTIFKNKQKNQLQKCIEHNNSLSHFCRDCKVVICSSCIYSKGIHRSHNITTLKQAQKDIKSVNQKLKSKISKTQQFYRQMIAASSNNITTLQRNLQLAIAQIRSHLNQTKAVLTEKCQQLQNRVRRNTEAAIEHNNMVNKQFFDILIFFQHSQRKMASMKIQIDQDIFQNYLFSELVKARLPQQKYLHPQKPLTDLFKENQWTHLQQQINRINLKETVVLNKEDPKLMFVKLTQHLTDENLMNLIN